MNFLPSFYSKNHLYEEYMYTPFLTSPCAGAKIKLAHSGDTNAETIEILLSNS